MLNPVLRRRCYPCDFAKACHALWMVWVWGWTQQQAGLVLGVHRSTINHIVHRRRFRDAFPVQEHT